MPYVRECFSYLYMDISNNSYFFDKCHTIIAFVRTKFGSLAQKGGWIQAQKVQNNEFVESELENQDLVNQTTSKVDLNDKRMKIDKFKLKKIVLDTVRGDQFLYIDSQI